jgi:hypothetical protein
MTKLIEAPAETKMLPPSLELTREAIKRGKDEGVITQLGADALDGVNPDLIKSVLSYSTSLGKPRLH